MTAKARHCRCIMVAFLVQQVSSKGFGDKEGDATKMIDEEVLEKQQSEKFLLGFQKSTSIRDGLKMEICSSVIGRTNKSNTRSGKRGMQN